MPEPAIITGFMLVLIRTGAMVLSSPLLGWGSGFAGYKVAFTITLSIVLYLVIGGPIEAADPIALGAMALREVLIGAFLSFIMHLLMLAVMVGGELIGHEMGFMMARQVDPQTGAPMPLIAAIYQNMFVLALLSSNAHHWLIAALRGSFERAPIGRVSLSSSIAPTIVEMFGELFRAGLAFAAPVMVLLVLVSILMGLLSRMVPHLNVLEVGFSIRIILALLAMFTFAPLVEPAIDTLQTSLQTWLDRSLDALEA